MDKPWFYGNLRGIGVCFFRAHTSALELGGDIEISHITAMEMKGPGQIALGKWGPIGLLFDGRLTMRGDSVEWYTPLKPAVAEKCREIWGSIAVAPATALHRLNGGRAP